MKDPNNIVMYVIGWFVTLVLAVIFHTEFLLGLLALSTIFLCLWFAYIMLEW